MAKVTSKLQVTIPKSIAEQYRIVPGDEIHFQPAGQVIRIVPPQALRPRLSRGEARRLFDANQRALEEKWRAYGVDVEALESPSLDEPGPEVLERRWTREMYYEEREARFDRRSDLELHGETVTPEDDGARRAADDRAGGSEP